MRGSAGEERWCDMTVDEAIAEVLGAYRHEYDGDFYNFVTAAAGSILIAEIDRLRAENARLREQSNRAWRILDAVLGMASLRAGARDCDCERNGKYIRKDEEAEWAAIKAAEMWAASKTAPPPSGPFHAMQHEGGD